MNTPEPDQSQPCAGEGWRPIETHADSFPVLVSRPTEREIYTPTTAFMDVTGVWRVFRSKGGMEPLPFEPTYWMPLPPAPGSEPSAHPLPGEGVEELRGALRDLIRAVTYNPRTEDFGGTPTDPNPCYVARVPVEFVTQALTALQGGGSGNG